MEKNIATSMAYHVATNNTLQALQSQKNQILQLISELTMNAKQRKVSTHHPIPDQEMAETATTRLSLVAPNTDSDFDASRHQGPTSGITLALRARPPTTTKPEHRPLSKKQKSVHSDSEHQLTAATASQATVQSLPSPTQPVTESLPMEVSAISTDITTYANNTMEEPMEFVDGDDASSLHSASDLDDQYNYNDPDGGDSG
jgi:hypothetical protein